MVWKNCKITRCFVLIMIFVSRDLTSKIDPFQSWIARITESSNWQELQRWRLISEKRNAMLKTASTYTCFSIYQGLTYALFRAE